MGLSSMAAAAMLAAVVLAAVLGMAVMDGWRGDSASALRERAQILEGGSREAVSLQGFNATNLTDTVMNVSLRLFNAGSTPIRPDCLDLYVDGSWVGKTVMSAAPIERRFDEGLWNPGETLQLDARVLAAVGEHNATVVSCGGAKAEGRFNASICGDNVCLGGEYCARDNSSCPDNPCHNPVCLNGCGQTAITDAVDPGQCDGGNEAGDCLRSPCQCGPDSVCCGVNLANCADDANCCPGFTCQQGDKCRPA
jgi:hypothetical protein